jgi:hypothetical protein
MWGSGFIAPSFSCPAPDGGEWSAPHPWRFIPRERATDTHFIGSWMRPRAGLDCVKRKISCHCRESNPDFSAIQPVAMLTKQSWLCKVRLKGKISPVFKHHIMKEMSWPSVLLSNKWGCDWGRCKRTKATRNIYRNVVWKPEGKDHLIDLGLDGRTILKWILYILGCRLEWTGPRYGTALNQIDDDPGLW